MNYKIIFLLLFVFIFACNQQKNDLKYTKNYEFYSNKGFTLIYNDQLLKDKIINKSIDERSLIVLNNNLSIDTPVKITNLINGKDLIAKIGRKSSYPKFYNSVISDRIAKDLEINPLEPYIKIQTINNKNSFIANKAKTFDEEKKVALKVPVESITIKNIGVTDTKQNKKKPKKKLKFNYIIKFADLYFEDSAIMLKKRLINEFNIKNVLIKKISENNFRVYKGPFKNLEAIKNEFFNIKNLDFENIEFIKL